MITTDTTALHLPEILRSELFTKKTGLWLVIFALFTGFSAGIFFSLYFSSADRASLISPITNMFSSGQSFTPDLFFKDCIPMLLVFLCGYSLYCFPFILLIIFTEGLAAGFCTGLTFCVNDFSVFLSVFFSCLLILPAYILSCFVSFNYAVLNISASGSQRLYTREYIFTVLLSMALILISGIIESFFTHI